MSWDFQTEKRYVGQTRYLKDGWRACAWEQGEDGHLLGRAIANSTDGQMCA